MSPHPTDKQIKDRLDELAAEIATNGGKKLGIVGIRTGGEKLAEVIYQRISKDTNLEVFMGMLDITLYRDDLDRAGALDQPIVRATEIDFSFEDMRVVLIDDVLFTGRTARAALDAVCDLGRPEKIELCVLVDREFRELPIAPNYYGFKLKTEQDERVNVVWDDKSGWKIKVKRASGK